MIERIYKYEISLGKNGKIEMPIGAEILHVGYQGSEPCLWARVAPDSQKESRQFTVYGTGMSLIEYDDDRVEMYLGTTQCDHGLVWHVFEVL